MDPRVVLAFLFFPIGERLVRIGVGVLIFGRSLQK